MGYRNEPIGRPPVDAGRLWAGGVATAAVAALIAVVGVLLCSDLLGLAMVQPPLLPVGGTFMVSYAVTAAAIAIVATGLAHLLLLTTPRPRSFFSWILGLATVAGVVVPFTLDGTTSGRLATALVDLVIGIAITALLTSVMTVAARPGVGPVRPR